MTCAFNCRTRVDGKFIQVNKMFEEIVGLPRTAVIGRTVFEIYPPALAGRAYERDLEVIRSAQQIADETVIGQGAARRAFLDVKFPLFDAAGAVRATAGIATEITVQKLMEEALVKLANTDVLTGLGNRRCFFENLAQEFNRSRRYAHRLTVIALTWHSTKPSTKDAIVCVLTHECGPLSVSNRTY